MKYFYLQEIKPTVWSPKHHFHFSSFHYPGNTRFLLMLKAFVKLEVSNDLCNTSFCKHRYFSATIGITSYLYSIGSSAGWIIRSNHFSGIDEFCTLILLFMHFLTLYYLYLFGELQVVNLNLILSLNALQLLQHTISNSLHKRKIWNLFKFSALYLCSNM